MEREKILNGLRCHSGCERGFDCDNCDYIGNGDCSELLARDALNLMKKQEEQIERIKRRPDDAQMSDEDMAKYVAKLRDSITIDLPKETTNMADKKQVMSWLEGLAQDDWPMFHSESEVQEIAKNALELLKEQDAVEPMDIIDEKYPVGDSNRYKGFRCGKCKEVIPWDANYCLYCGRKVKWND